MRKIFEWSMAILTCMVLGISLNSCAALMNVATAVNGMTIETPGRRMGVQVQNMELTENGKQLVISFLLTYQGQDISTYWIGKTTNEQMEAYDNLGTKATVRMYWGDKDTGGPGMGTGEIGSRLPGNTPVLMKVVVKDFNPQATRFTQIKFYGRCVNVQCEGANGAFIFKNVPITK